MKRIASIVLLLTSLCCLVSAQERKSSTYDETITLLAKLENVKNNEAILAKLFKVGDRRIEDLISALNSPDTEVSRRAQIVIRYLANPKGMNCLLAVYEHKSETIIAGPVPQPLSDWDYRFITNHFLSRPARQWVDADSYVFALALDTSPRARSMLQALSEKFDDLDSATRTGRALKQVGLANPNIRLGERHLNGQVLKHAFFVSSADEDYTTSKFVGFNGSKDKALFRVHINRGILSEEWYHVVVKKIPHGWEYEAITLIAIS